MYCVFACTCLCKRCTFRLITSGGVFICDRGGLNAHGCFYHCLSALRNGQSERRSEPCYCAFHFVDLVVESKHLRHFYVYLKELEIDNRFFFLKYSILFFFCLLPVQGTWNTSTTRALRFAFCWCPSTCGASPVSKRCVGNALSQVLCLVKFEGRHQLFSFVYAQSSSAFPLYSLFSFFGATCSYFRIITDFRVLHLCRPLE